MATRDQVKQWFETNDYPTQEQFWAWIDSSLFPGEVTMGDIAGLTEALSSKLDSANFDAFHRGELIVAGGNVVYPQPANTLIEKIIILPGADTQVRIGLTNGGAEIIPDVDVSAALGEVFVINKFSLVARNIYINGIPGDSKIIIIKRSIKIQ